MFFFLRSLTEKDEHIADLQTSMNTSKTSVEINPIPERLEQEIQTDEQQIFHRNDNEQPDQQLIVIIIS